MPRSTNPEPKPQFYTGLGRHLHPKYTPGILHQDPYIIRMLTALRFRASGSLWYRKAPSTAVVGVYSKPQKV